MWLVLDSSLLMPQSCWLIIMTHDARFARLSRGTVKMSLNLEARVVPWNASFSSMICECA